MSALLGVAAIGITTVALAPAANAAGPYGAAYVVLPDANPGRCQVPTNNTWNSAHWNAVNEICPDGVGLYSVYLPSLAAAAGTVQVTAYGSDAAYCKVQGWAPSGTRQRIRVRCLDPAGNVVNSRFAVSYANLAGTGGAGVGYVLASEPGTANYTPPANYQYNSSGAANTVWRQDVGEYVVFMPGIGGADFSPQHAQATALGTANGWCHVVQAASGWGNATEAFVRVRCFNMAGRQVDSLFTVSYARSANILGQWVCCSPDGHPTAYLYADDRTRSSYEVPRWYFYSGSGGTARITRLATGRYEVDYGSTAAAGVIHVTAGSNGEDTIQNTDPALCKVQSWPSNRKVVVKCTSPTGAARDSRFWLHHVGPFIVG